jgi:hypothetical protein
MIGIVLMSLVISAAVAQSAPQGQEATQETQARGFWTDPSTKLTWAAKDSGKGLSYKGAVKYCRGLRLAGFSDWRLATLAELQGIYDKTANAPGLSGPHGKDPNQFHVKGNLFLTGDPWAYGLWGKNYGTENVFSFNNGRSNDHSSGFWSVSEPALCVRESAPQGQEATPETQVRGFWTDPSTSLMWAAKDSGKDVSYESAVQYCRDLRLAGHSAWRLATLGELQGIYDKTARAPGLAGAHGEVRNRWHVKGNLFLTGDQWAYDQSGRTGEGQDSFNFDVGRSNNPNRFLYTSFFFKRALCVRGSGK